MITKVIVIAGLVLAAVVVGLVLTAKVITSIVCEYIEDIKARDEQRIASAD